MRSSKSRSRNKNRNRPQGGNVINRVFDSSGPEGKVRGTPQQIIDKYNQLARDAQLSGDRVATENFQQHAEHYTRMLAQAQKEMDARREQQAQQNGAQQNNGQQNGGQGGQQGGGQQNDGPDRSGEAQGEGGQRRDGGRRDRRGREDRSRGDVIETQGADAGLVETPEARAEGESPRGDAVETVEAPAETSDAAPAEEAPKRRRTRRKATKTDAGPDAAPGDQADTAAEEA